MQVDISLAPKGPSMWFLGTDPKALVAHLTFANPGPVTLDFDDLTGGERLHILASQRAGQIEVSVPFDQLRQHYLGIEKKKEEVVEEEIPKFVKDTLTKLNEKNEKQAAKVKDLVALGIKGFRSAIADETDLRLLQQVLRTESTEKNRKTAIKIINDRIAALQKQIIKTVERAAKEPPVKLSRYKDPVSYDDDVVESEQEVISFTLE